MMNMELQKRLLSSLIMVPTALFFILKGSIFFTFFHFVVFIATIKEWLDMCKKKKSMKFLGVIFLIISFYLAYILRINEGAYLFIFIVLISVCTDIGGYIFGKLLKGPKITKISPNKTFSGVVGGFIVSLIGALVFYEHMPINLSSNFKSTFEEFISFDLYLFFIILMISMISQIGDLIISYFKRQAKIKDTGQLLPGHGGLLDRVDGIIFVIPFSFLILNL